MAQAFLYPFLFYVIILLSAVSIVSDSFIKNILYTIGGDFLQSKLDYYLEANQDSTFNSAYTSTQILFRGIINRTLYFFIPLILLRKYRKQDNYMNALFNIYFYGFCLFIMVTPLSPALGRLCTYTDMSQAILLPYIFQMKMNKYNTYLLMTIVILYFIIRFRGIVTNYYEAYIPYKCVLFK